MLNEEALARALATAGLEAPVRWDDVTTSTNETALAMARGGAPNWTLVGAGHQTAGRGRAGRAWIDRPGGGLMVSVVLRPTFPPDRVGLVSLAAGAAMAEAASDVTDVRVRCKWPNDLLLSDAKVGGILAESDVDGDVVRHVVVGVGVNLEAPEDVPGAGGIGAVDEGRLLGAFLERLASLLDGAPTDVVARWRASSDTIGRRVEATTADGTVVRGEATDVDETGALLVETPTRGGARARVAFGDVRHLEPLEPDPDPFRLLGGGFFQRFSADARTVIVRADRLSSELGHPRVRPGHVLIALGEVGPNLATRALGGARFDAARAREDLSRFLDVEAIQPGARPEPRPRGPIARAAVGRFDPATKKVLETSLRVVLRAGHDWIGVEHLLLAILERNDPDVASMLASQQVSLDVVRRALGEGSPPGERRLRRRGGSR